jgi:hypothetical protein
MAMTDASAYYLKWITYLLAGILAVLVFAFARQ